jgi:outer membrane protein OmpA-like peptidoglycan-associated protein
LTAKISENETLAKKIALLKENLDKLSIASKQKIEKVKKDLTGKLGLLQTQKVSVEKKLSAELEREKQLIAEKEELQDKVEFLKKELESTNSNNEQLQSQIDELNKELEVKDKELQELKAEKEKIAQKAEAKQKLLTTFSLTNVQFKNNSSELTKESKDRLDITAEKIKKYGKGFRFEIQGHTDNRGNEAYNIKLSTKRAEATKKYLVEKGVPADILTTKGFGSSMPIADNNTKEGRSKNRRVVFIIHEEK